MLLSKTYGPDSKNIKKKFLNKVLMICKGTGIKKDFVSDGEKLQYNNV